MKTLSFIAIMLVFHVTVVAQDREKERLRIITQFIQDLQRDVSNADIFKKYLHSGGVFDNEKISQTANEWTGLLRNSLKSSISGEIAVYKYSDRPEKGRKLKSIEDPDNELVEYTSLEFELYSSNNTIVAVETNDLYVIKFREERIFVLFDDTDKLITYFGLRWGQKVELTEF